MKNKVSKLLTARSAYKEYAEYERISKIDKTNKYHLGKPILCDADPIDLLEKTRKHRCKKYNENKDQEPFKLLIADYGGIDLKEFCEKNLYEKKFTTETIKKTVYGFFLNALNLFKGIRLFLSNNIIHRDIKPSNILIKKNGELTFIDFGLTENIDEFKKKLITGDQKQKFHWSYPLEYGFLRDAEYYVNLEPNELVKLKENTVHMLLEDTKSDAYYQFENTFDMLNNRLSPYTKTIKELMIGDTIHSMSTFKNNSNMFIHKSIKSMDTYAMGLTLNYVLNAFYDNNMIEDNFYRDLHELFEKMYDFDLNTRLVNINEIIDAYETILQKYNIKRRINSSSIIVKQARIHKINKTKKMKYNKTQ